jgi:chromosome segregation ATPase
LIYPTRGQSQAPDPFNYRHIVEQIVRHRGREFGLPPGGAAGHSAFVSKAASSSAPPIALSEGDELLEARRQIRQMVDTVAALRTQLEQAETLRRESVQAALTVAQDEIRQLQHTVGSLRDELQALSAAKTESVQAAVATGQDESKQLHAAIQALRDEMERQTHLHAAERDRLQRAANEEIKQLRDSIASLRTQLEAQHAR